MGFYVDKKDRKWTFTLNYGLILYLKDSMNIDLLEPYTNGNTTLQDIIQNRYRMLEVLYQIVKYSNKQASENEIWESFSGDAIIAAQEAFFTDWVNFSRESGRPDTAAAIQKAQELIQAGIRAAEAEINALDSKGAIERISRSVRSELATLTTSSGGSQEG